jgi:hypothetical protein
MTDTEKILRIKNLEAERILRMNEYPSLPASKQDFVDERLNQIDEELKELKAS